MKRSLFILSVVCGMCCMSFCSCRFGQSDGDEDGEKDSIGVDSLGLEELDLYEEVVIPKTADEVFDDFLFSYISNASFSQERTVGSVNELAMNDDDAAVMIYEREDDLVLQKDTTLQEVIVEQIEWEQNTIHNYQFNKKLGQWFLVAEVDDELSGNPNASFLVFLMISITIESSAESTTLLVLSVCAQIGVRRRSFALGSTRGPPADIL